jgi:hypothetical protein
MPWRHAAPATSRCIARAKSSRGPLVPLEEVFFWTDAEKARLAGMGLWEFSKEDKHRRVTHPKTTGWCGSFDKHPSRDDLGAFRVQRQNLQRQGRSPKDRLPTGPSKHCSLEEKGGTRSSSNKVLLLRHHQRDYLAGGGAAKYSIPLFRSLLSCSK